MKISKIFTAVVSCLLLCSAQAQLSHDDYLDLAESILNKRVKAGVFKCPSMNDTLLETSDGILPEADDDYLTVMDTYNLIKLHRVRPVSGNTDPIIFVSLPMTSSHGHATSFVPAPGASYLMFIEQATDLVDKKTYHKHKFLNEHTLFKRLSENASWHLGGGTTAEFDFSDMTIPATNQDIRDAVRLFKTIRTTPKEKLSEALLNLKLKSKHMVELNMALIVKLQ